MVQTIKHQVEFLACSTSWVDLQLLPSSLDQSICRVNITVETLAIPLTKRLNPGSMLPRRPSQPSRHPFWRWREGGALAVRLTRGKQSIFLFLHVVPCLSGGECIFGFVVKYSRGCVYHSPVYCFISVSVSSLFIYLKKGKTSRLS